MLEHESAASDGVGTRVGEHMTPNPAVVASRADVAAADALMRARCIKHLPVVDDGAIVGLVSEHELHRRRGSDELVADVMQRDPPRVAATTPVLEVCAIMSAGGHRCVLVVDGTRLVGVFTTSDAVRAVARLGPPAFARRPAPSCDRWGHLVASDAQTLRVDPRERRHG